MAYTTNPYAPRARRDAVNLVLKHGIAKAEAARRTGVHRSTISRWIKKRFGLFLDGRELIPTLNSAPRQPANSLPVELVKAIVDQRKTSQRCAEVVWHELKRKGVTVSLSSVKRVIKREGLTRERSKWARYRPRTPRPLPETPGDLVQIDTIHFIDWRADYAGERYYIYTIIDLASRWAYAEYSEKIGVRQSIEFTRRAHKEFKKASGGQVFRCVQSDNGSEFSVGFTDALNSNKIKHRHTRVRRSNDNAHIERFNRTVQEEGLKTTKPLPKTIRRKLKPFINYYNHDRLHLNINCLTPTEMLQRL